MSNEPFPDDISDKVSAAFKKGTVFEASNNDLDLYLRWTASEPIPNELIRHAQIIRASTIHTIKTDRYLKKANLIIVVLTIVALFVSVFSIYFTAKQTSDSETQIRELINLQKQQVELLDQQSKKVEKPKLQSTPAMSPASPHADKEH